MSRVNGKVAFVTGGAGGIGLGIAKAFARAGAKVAVADIDKAALEEATEGLRASGAEAVAVPLDVTDRAGWEAAVDQVEKSFGTVHLLVNNAGVSTAGMNFEDATPAIWDRVVAINLTGVYNGIHHFLPGMRAAGGGHIVNTASAAGLAGYPHLSPYAATKFAVVGLSESLHAEFESDGIGVSVLCPGLVRTRLWRTSRKVRELPDVDVPPDDVTAMSAKPYGMDPDEVGRRVLAGVENNDLYIFTHPEFRQPVLQRQEQLMRGFDQADSFSP
ncbi:SDR family oxidoreductase [Nonomuraea sp. NPDC050153]|uniref:SDR family oxidoreductase n=1 Tax=Nonomuraea sp. NPDC050153 TaxID=3364359 RepID=UPI0037B781CA